MDIGSSLSAKHLTSIYQSGSDQGKAPQDLKEAAEAFEAIFVNELLKSMRQANEAMMGSSDLPMSGKDVQFFQSMFDSHIAGHLGKEGGLGIAEALVRQLGDTNDWLNTERESG
ncbi:rod-binding protein [Endozoicomonas sp. 4G]|uniref:rod-binding protein n=1 Tax=Endozoicomonas sp. 4G TaxID=2872754 RepID=UPI0020790731|nr:rod-binding protein [Endozoicomonas sp. 4G]